MILCILQFISLPFLIICLLPALESGFLKLRASIKMRFEQLKLRIKYLRCPWLASVSVTDVSVTPKEMFTVSTSLMWLAQIREELLLPVAWFHDYESLCWPQFGSWGHSLSGANSTLETMTPIWVSNLDRKARSINTTRRHAIFVVDRSF